MTFIPRGSLILLVVVFSLSVKTQTLNVAFIGNSYTGYNNLPGLLEQLALSGGDTVFTQRSVMGGYSLAQHLDNSSTIDLIKQGIWHFVILQEQSQHPDIPYYRDNFTYPSADSLNELIHINNTCVTTVFYMTWGRKYGGMQCIGQYCSPDFVDYFHMQDSLESAYLTMAYDNLAFCAPVGISWRNSIANGDPIELFTQDNSHPTLAGSYLAACTFYATIFNKSPEGISYTGGLSAMDAEYLQQVAAYTVLNNPVQWNILHPDPVEAFFTYELDEFHAQFWNESVAATEFLWNFGDTASGMYNTSTYTNPVHNFSGPGTFTVTLTASHPCLESDMYADTIVILETGLHIRHAEIVKVYPNPSDEWIRIESADGFNKFRILDINGNICQEGEILSSSLKLPTIHIPAGLYLLVLQGKEKQYTEKIIIR
jgi:hypothetical protein